MKETRTDRIEKANEILHLYAPKVSMIERRGKLWLSRRNPDWPKGDALVCAILNSSGCSLKWRYDRLGFGGTCAQATAMLIRWVRDDTRLPLSAWRYWTSPTVLLAREHGPELIAALEASSYPDPLKTGCVLCGNSDIGDWWSLDGKQGPCCGWRDGCRQQVKA